MASATLTTAATNTAGPVDSSSVCHSACSTTSATAAATSSKGLATTVSNAQAVGISVAAFGVIIIAVCVVYLVACMRRRKFDKRVDYRSSYDFVDEAPPQLSELHHSYSYPQDRLGEAGLGKKVSSEKKRKSEWYHEQFPSPFLPSGELAPRHSPKSKRGDSLDSQESAGSMRTLSQLLPDRPGSTPPLPPPKHYSHPPATPATIFEEFSKSPRVPSEEYSSMPQVPKPIMSLPGRNIKRPEYAAQMTRSPETLRHPSLSIDIPKQATRPAKIPAPINFPLPPIPADVAHDARERRTSASSRAKSQASTTGGSVLNYYASPDAGNTFDFGPLPTPIDPNVQTRRAVPAAITITRPPCPQRAVRQSTGSDTSFESTDPDEPTPPDESDKQLSPVHEHSPIAAVRYPKIPRSSNQSIPRSPPARLSPAYDHRLILPSQRREPIKPEYQDTAPPDRPRTTDSTLSGSTLATKRRCDDPPRERRLYIDTSHSRLNSRSANRLRSLPKSEASSSEDERPKHSERHESPLKGYGRGRGNGLHHNKMPPPSGGLLSPEMTSPVPQFARTSIALQTVVLKSPLWEPKLTPRRQGEDLFLEVGVASPMYPPSPAAKRRL